MRNRRSSPINRGIARAMAGRHECRYSAQRSVPQVRRPYGGDPPVFEIGPQLPFPVNRDNRTRTAPDRARLPRALPIYGCLQPSSQRKETARAVGRAPMRAGDHSSNQYSLVFVVPGDDYRSPTDLFGKAFECKIIADIVGDQNTPGPKTAPNRIVTEGAAFRRFVGIVVRHVNGFRLAKYPGQPHAIRCPELANVVEATAARRLPPNRRSANAGMEGRRYTPVRR